MNYIKYNIKENIHNLNDTELFSNYYKTTNKIKPILPGWLIREYYQWKTPDDLIYCRYVRVSDDFLWVVYDMSDDELSQLQSFVLDENVTDREIEEFLNAMCI